MSPENRRRKSPCASANSRRCPNASKLLKCDFNCELSLTLIMTGAPVSARVVTLSALSRNQVPRFPLADSSKPGL
jgi:hypothetical protein